MHRPTLRRRWLLPAALAALCAAPAEAALIDLGFGTLPTAQGWRYFALGNDAPESSVFAADGSRLMQNSLGLGYAAQGSNDYHFYNAFATPGSGFRLSVRARLTGEESQTNHWGFGFFVLDGTGTEYGFGLASGLVVATDATVALATDIFRDYLLIGTPGAVAGTGTYQLFADGALLATGNAWSHACASLGPQCNDLIFGDGTGGANAAGEIAGLSLRETSAVPEPGTLALLLSALGLGLGQGAWRRRRGAAGAGPRRRGAWVAAPLAVLGWTAAPLHAGVIDDWDAASGLLPDALSPAWTFGGLDAYRGQGLANGVLTIATGALWEGWIFAHALSPTSLATGFSVEARMRYVSGSSADASRAPSVVGLSLGGNRGNALYIDRDRVFLLAENLTVGASAAVDTDETLHTYRIDLDALGALRVFYDGAALLSGETFANALTFGPDPLLMFGDITVLASGTGEWMFVRDTPTAQAPLPGAVWLLACGLIPWAAGVRRRPPA